MRSRRRELRSSSFAPRSLHRRSDCTRISTVGRKQRIVVPSACTNDRPLAYGWPPGKTWIQALSVAPRCAVPNAALQTKRSQVSPFSFFGPVCATKRATDSKGVSHITPEAYEHTLFTASRSAAWCPDRLTPSELSICSFCALETCAWRRDGGHTLWACWIAVSE